MAVAKLYRELLTREALEGIIRIVTRKDRSNFPDGLPIEAYVLWDNISEVWPGPGIFEDVCAHQLQFDPEGKHAVAAYLWTVLYILMPVLPEDPQTLYWKIVFPGKGGNPLRD